MHRTDGASSAGPSTATSEETSTAGTVRGLRDQGITTRPEYAAGPSGTATATPDNLPKHAYPAIGASDVERKQLATLVARACIAGYELVRLADGTFIASRWGMFRSLDHIAAVEAFLVRVGAPR